MRRPSLITGLTGAMLFFVSLTLLVEIENGRTENARLRVAFAAAVERSPLSCELVEGERVICAARDGRVSRLSLGATDQVVSAPVPGRPLGKKKRRHHGG